MPGGISSAIASGSALGKGGGQGSWAGAGAVLFGKGLAEGMLTDTSFGQGFSLESSEGFFGMIFNKVRGTSFLSGFFDMFNEGTFEGMEFINLSGGATGETSSGGNSGGSSFAHSAIGEIAMPALNAGMAYAGDFSMRNGVTPDSTPSRGAGIGVGMRFD